MSVFFRQAASFLFGNRIRLDDDDMHLLETITDPKLACDITSIVRDESDCRRLEVNGTDRLDERAWRRMGYIVGQNTHLVELQIIAIGIDLEGLCAGLLNNRSIQVFEFIMVDHLIQDSEKMNCLAPFLRTNPSLKKIAIPHSSTLSHWICWC